VAGQADPWVLRVDRQPDEDAEINEGFQRTRTAAWDVLVKPEYAHYELTAFLTHTQLPAYLSPFYTLDRSFIDYLCVLRSVSIRREPTNKLKLRLSYKYSTTPLPGVRGAGGQKDPLSFPRPAKKPKGDQDAGIDGGGAVQDPTEVMMKVSTDYEPIQTPTRFSYTGSTDDLTTAIAMSNSRYPDPLPNLDDAIFVINITKMQPFFSWLAWHEYRFSLNNGEWNGFPAQSVLCMPWRVSELTEIGGLWYFPTTYQFKVHPDFWTYRLTSWDIYQKPLAGTNLEPIVDPLTKQPVTAPWPLNAAGRMIPDITAPGVTVHTANHRLAKLRDFDLLGFDLSDSLFWTPPVVP
jgi:hypothetical protein